MNVAFVFDEEGKCTVLFSIALAAWIANRQVDNFDKSRYL